MSNTHFGFETVEERDKARRVKGVFDSVANKYDIMNDVMSLGLHRLWKAYTHLVADVQTGHHILDIAAGTGDLTRRFAQKVGPTGRVFHTDINLAMLKEGRDRLINEGLAVPSLVCDAEQLPFSDQSFDRVSVAFGLRNMTHKDKALAEMLRVLKPGGKLLILEFSKIIPPLVPLYDFYSLKILPHLGQWIAQDAHSYRYLAESIRMHPDQQTLKTLMKQVGFAHVDVHNMSAGIVALHTAIKINSH